MRAVVAMKAARTAVGTAVRRTGTGLGWLAFFGLLLGIALGGLGSGFTVGRRSGTATMLKVASSTTTTPSSVGPWAPSSPGIRALSFLA
jgi:hypothetical protein